MIVAIHQPNFFPWLGYFNKISKCDKFIFLDNVKLQGGSSWSNRVQIAIKGEPSWLTAEISSKSRNRQNINLCEFNNSNWNARLWQTIYHNYRKSAKWEKISGVIEPLIMNEERVISKFNVNGIVEIASRMFERLPEFFTSSHLQVSTDSTQRLIDLTLGVGGDCYFSGDGAAGYQDTEIFVKNNIKLMHANFKHPIYFQKNKLFIPGLSILDALFNLGFEDTGKLLQSPK